MATTLVVRSVVCFTRALLCIQGVFIGTLGWAAWAAVPPGESRTPNTIAALLASVVAVSSFATAVHMRQGRKWAAISAVAIEALWAVASLWDAMLPAGPPRWQYILGFALALAALTGLALKPVRQCFKGSTGGACPLPVQ